MMTAYKTVTTLLYPKWTLKLKMSYIFHITNKEFYPLILKMVNILKGLAHLKGTCPCFEPFIQGKISKYLLSADHDQIAHIFQYKLALTYYN
jgi:hypothetical protein